MTASLFYSLSDEGLRKGVWHLYERQQKEWNGEENGAAVSGDGSARIFDFYSGPDYSHADGGQVFFYKLGRYVRGETFRGT